MKSSLWFSRLTATLLISCAVVGALPSAAQNPTPARAEATSAKLQFFFRLTPPRPTFVTDMTAAEGELMKQHAAYWADLFKAGKVLILGPVLDPKGVFGMGVIEAATEAEARAMADNDPSVKAGLNKVDVAPMHVFLHR